MSAPRVQVPWILVGAKSVSSSTSEPQATPHSQQEQPTSIAPQEPPNPLRFPKVASYLSPSRPSGSCHQIIWRSISGRAPTTLLVSPSFIGTNKHEHHPSLAPSGESKGSWERASDIFDDYWYLRLASKMSTPSWCSVNAASGIAPTPLVPESRPDIDLSGSRQQVARRYPLLSRWRCYIGCGTFSSVKPYIVVLIHFWFHR